MINLFSSDCRQIIIILVWNIIRFEWCLIQNKEWPICICLTRGWKITVSIKTAFGSISNEAIEFMFIVHFQSFLQYCFLFLTFVCICLFDTARILSSLNGNVDRLLHDFAYQLRWTWLINVTIIISDLITDHWILNTERVLNLIAYWLKMQSISVFAVCHSNWNRHFL